MILGKKKRRRALALITSCQIIAEAEIRDVDSFSHMTDNLAELAYLTGGVTGMKIVKQELDEYWKCRGVEIEMNVTGNSEAVEYV